MEIGPITGIRPMPMLKPSRSQDELAGVFATDLRRQDEEESYTPNHKAARGLEDEEEGGLTDESASGEPEPLTPPRNISFFA